MQKGNAMFDLWDAALFESIYPGSLTDSYELECGGCGQVYSLEGEADAGNRSICPHCNTENIEE